MQLRQVTTAFAAGATGLMIAMSAPLALAHDSVVGGNVVSDAPLEEFPREITLEFSGIPKETFNTFAVSDQDSGKVLFDGTPTIDGRDLTVEVPQDVQPGAGDYQVGFRITSSDGHSTVGSVEFSVAGGEDTDGASDSEGAGGADDTAADSDASSSDGVLDSLPTAAKWIIGIGAVLVIAAVVVAFGAKTRRANGEE
ncbi:copper resistance protein CopC [Corynebacterium sp. YSMAA1_1_D6]|uniref:copper resistance CopC family protein n=1 Tax=unclassified Corynebacterium TaxID=2624378 RepID=UPI0027B96378|nr:copper resistance protein CopC [Corynebacterium sp.]